MTSNDYAFWLRGYVEITNGQYPDPTQWQIIKDHLDLVFEKVTPDRHTTLPNRDSDDSVNWPPTGYVAAYPGARPFVSTGLNPYVSITC